MGMSGGGGGGGSASQGYQYNRGLQQQLQQALSSSTQGVWGPQANALTNMYGGAQGLMNRQAGAVPGAAAAQQGAVMPAARAGLTQMQQFAKPNSALARRQLADYSRQVGQNFKREILPGIRSGAGVSGNMGGSRAALAQGVAAGDAARAIAQGGTDIYSHQYDTAAQAAQLLPQMAGQVYNLGMSPFAAQWAPYSSAAGVFGGPTTLTQQGSQSFGISQGQQMGENWNTQMGNPTKPQWQFSLF